MKCLFSYICVFKVNNLDLISLCLLYFGDRCWRTYRFFYLSFFIIGTCVFKGLINLFCNCDNVIFCIFLNIKLLYFLDYPQDLVNPVALAKFSGVTHVEYFGVFNNDLYIVVKLKLFDNVQKTLVFESIYPLFPEKVIGIPDFSRKHFSVFHDDLFVGFQCNAYIWRLFVVNP